ncbi:MAG: penicillin acylase family protein [Bacteriovoracaceae bacterium]|nr:penicillin acylase family protein [Bacteriovoracaceae bacterium]
MTKKKHLKIGFVILGVLALLITSGLFYLKQKGAPTYEGSLALKGLKSTASIKYDKSGIPHITSFHEEDAYMALGFVMAQERLFQMDLLRRMAKGQLSEIFGKKAISADKTFRTLSLIEHFRTRLTKGEVDPNVLRVMKSFFKGVNQFIGLKKWPFEYSLLGVKPKPFEEVDAYGVLSYMAYSFATAFKTDPFLESLEKKLGKERVNELRRVPLQNVQERTVNQGPIQLKGESPWREGHRFISERIGLFSGSNAWALKGERSEGGLPILASDPHIGFGIPGLWFEAHLKWEKGLLKDNFEYYGHFVPALPFAAMAHNKHHAWAVTISYIDDFDFIREKVDGDKIKWKEGWEDLSKREEVIHILGEDSVSLEIQSTPNGPLVTDILSKFNLKETSPISIQWAHHDRENRPALALYRALLSHDKSEFESSLSLGRSPGLNIIYADSENNIARYLFGGMWKRPKNMTGDRLYHREDQAFSELEYIDFFDRPHLINPAEGVVVSANQKPEGTASMMAGYFQPIDRYQTIHEIIDSKKIWRLEELKFVQTANVNVFMKLYKQRIVDSLSTENSLTDKEKIVLKEFQKWEGDSNQSSINALVFYKFFSNFQRALLPELSEVEFNQYCDTNYLWHLARRELLKGEKKKLIIASYKKTISDLLKAHGPIVNWSLGLEQTLTLTHPLSRAGAHLAFFLDIGPEPMSGGFNQINNMRQVGCRDGLKVKAGPSTRRLVSLTRPEESWGILPLGNSGHYGSPFFKNQWPLFKEGKYRLQIMRPLKEEELFGELTLTP